MKDEQLNRLLREAPSELPVPDSFGREVWARIEARDCVGLGKSGPGVAWERFFGWLARPVPALATIGSFVILGAVFGMRSGPEFRRSVPRELVYVRSISPLGHGTIHEP